MTWEGTRSVSRLTSVSRVEAYWRALTDGQRCKLIALCCHSCGGCGGCGGGGCGKLDPSCRCWDDS